MIKQLHTSWSLLIASDLIRPHYQSLLITYLKFTKKNVKDARKEEKSNQCAVLLELKTINKIANVKNVKKMVKANKWLN